jgi:hypothetical protein
VELEVPPADPRAARVSRASHRWYGLDGQLIYEQTLLVREPTPAPAVEPRALCSEPC